MINLSTINEQDALPYAIVSVLWYQVWIYAIDI